jgi:hypothetical protein
MTPTTAERDRLEAKLKVRLIALTSDLEKRRHTMATCSNFQVSNEKRTEIRHFRKLQTEAKTLADFIKTTEAFLCSLRRPNRDSL